MERGRDNDGKFCSVSCAERFCEESLGDGGEEDSADLCCVEDTRKATGREAEGAVVETFLGVMISTGVTWSFRSSGWMHKLTSTSSAS